MSLVDPVEAFQGVVVITIPHMDDGVLACGGTIAKLASKERVHVIYATDGMRSPAPILPWRDAISPDLGVVRMREAKAAMRYLGVPENNIYFLGLPDGRLKSHRKTLSNSLIHLIRQIEPDHVLMPFRFDCHTDHLTLNQVITAAYQRAAFNVEDALRGAELTEYFVYHRWRLLPRGDVRNYIASQGLFQVDIEDVSAQKRTALNCFKSQTTKFYTWQTRPNLSAKLLDEVSRTPEFFLRYDIALPGAAIFMGPVTWIRLAHRLEPLLKKKKDQAVALWRIFTPEGIFDDIL